MVETKRKSRDEAKWKKNKKNQKIGDNRKRRGGVGLPSKMRKELDRLNPSADNSDVDEDIDFAEDLYEYEEGLAQEDSRRNRRFDRVENLEYKLPDEFEDENVSSDYDNEDSNVRDADANSDEDEGFDDGRHERMLQEITGMPSETGKKKKKKNNNVVISEPYPESEYNPSRDVLDGDGQINIEDLLDPLHGKSGYSKLRKRMRQMERKSVPIHAPLPKAEQGRLERKAAYEQSKKDLVKWEPLVKRNREAPTIYFDNKIDLGFSTVGAIASEFEPRTEFEKKIASLVSDDKVMDAHRKDGSRLLELNKVSIEDEKDRQNHIAKMRSLLFRHEMKAKHIKKIKSKTYHRLLKKDRLKAAENMMDPEAAKDLARKHEYERAKERMTLRHKSSSKWTKRIKERGFDVQDEGTRAAVAEQQHMHALLTRKRNSMRDSSSSGSEDSSDEDDINENVAGTDQGRASRLLREAKEKTLEVLNEDDEVPNSGLLSLPFMVRGMKKRNEVAAEEAKLALQDLESLSKQFVGSSEAEDPKLVPSSGRMVFGGGVKLAPKSSNKTESDGKIIGDRFYDNSDSEDHLEAEENDDPGNSKSNDLQKDVNVDSIVLHEDSDSHQGSLFKSFDEIVQDPGPKTTCDVAIFASGTWKKMKSGNNSDATNKKSHVSVQPVLQNQDLPETMKELEEDSDSDNEGGQMVDGILSSGPKPSYELPSQGELIRQAFAADDVEDDFEKDKMEILNEENPEPEKPVLLPGWGQWTNVQHKKGLPSWMLKEHENAKKKREEALKKRKDAALRNVIISEKLDKKAEKLYTKTLPFPFTSKEVFEQSIRMPIGPEFNPATAVGALNRPEVVKTPGVIIKPIEYENVDPYEKGDHSKQSARKQKKIKGKRKRAN